MPDIKDVTQPYQIEIKNLLQDLGTDKEKGLSNQEALNRLKQFGKNRF